MADSWHMASALNLARRSLGQVWPNPAVGCVLVRREDGRDHIVGRGWTGKGGRPHAETVAIAEAGDAAQGATAYVSLEPCAHHGQTPPCADALIEAGVSRAVVALADPDPRVNGEGIAKMRNAGIEVSVGLNEAEARRVNAGFISRVTRGRPLFALKSATSLDGRIATSTGESKWITAQQARDRGHLLRARYDAILVGAGTVAADDPALTCRLPGLEDRSPLRIVIDRKAELDPDARIFTTADAETWLVAGADAPKDKLAAFAARGVTVIPCSLKGESIDLEFLAKALADQGLTRVLIEGGAGIATAFLRAGLVDLLYWFRAGMIIGGDGLAAIGELGVKALGSAPRFHRLWSQALGADSLECFAAEGLERLGTV